VAARRPRSPWSLARGACPGSALARRTNTDSLPPQAARSTSPCSPCCSALASRRRRRCLQPWSLVRVSGRFAPHCRGARRAGAPCGGLQRAGAAGGGLSGTLYYMRQHHPDDPQRPLIDYRLSLVLTPSVLVGSTIGSHSCPTRPAAPREAAGSLRLRSGAACAACRCGLRACPRVPAAACLHQEPKDPSLSATSGRQPLAVARGRGARPARARRRAR